jgi:hypothetical protein
VWRDNAGGIGSTAGECDIALCFLAQHSTSGAPEPEPEPEPE